jgi:hypothetical protein
MEQMFSEMTGEIGDGDANPFPPSASGEQPLECDQQN